MIPGRVEQGNSRPHILICLAGVGVDRVSPNSLVCPKGHYQGGVDVSGLSVKSQTQGVEGVQRGDRYHRVRDGDGKSAAAGVVGGGFRTLVGTVVTIIVFLTPAGGA